jgi:tetratricopeptide (TPR) repeat protein
MQGRLDDAIKEYQMAIKLDPNYADAHYNLGLAYQKTGRLDDAVKEYQIAASLKPEYASALNRLGAGYRK